MTWPLRWDPGELHSDAQGRSALRRLHTYLRFWMPRWEAADIATSVNKQVDEARSSTTTLAADAELGAVLASAASYRARFLVWLTTANAVMGYKYDLNFTGTLHSLRLLRRHTIPGAPAGTDNEDTLAQTVSLGSTVVAGATSGLAYVEIEAVVQVNVGGILRFRWAQNTSDAGALTVKRGSHLALCQI